MLRSNPYFSLPCSGTFNSPFVEIVVSSPIMTKAIPPFLLSLLLCGLPCFAGNEYQFSKPGKLLLEENFDSSELPKLFTVGVGDWSIVDGALRGRQLVADKHTAFRKIYLDHKNVIYEYDMKLVGDGFHQLLINWGLAHIAKCVVRYDSAAVFKIREKGKREQMTKLNHDQGLDPLKGEWDEKTFAMDETGISIEEGKWHHVRIELVDDTLSLTVDGKTAQGQHVGLSEKKDNFGFQAGGFESYVFIDNVRVYEAFRKAD